MFAIPAMDLRPPEEDLIIDQVGPYDVYEGKVGLYLIHHVTGDRPEDIDVYRAGVRHKGAILKCGCPLTKGREFYLDGTGEARCSKHMDEALALEADDDAPED